MRPNDMPRPFAPEHSEEAAMGDLIERLRSYAEADDLADSERRDLTEAANELARLRAEVEELKGANNVIAGSHKWLSKQRAAAERERDELRRRIAEAPKGEVWQHACMGGQRTTNVVLTRDADDGLCPMGQRVALVRLDAEEGK